MALGRRLVCELGVEEETDTLGRWMAHYIAELMDASANCPPDERDEAQRTCFEAILKLWSHRAEFPSGMRPFQELEPICRAIESLDPDGEAPRYFPTIGTNMDKQNEDEETRPLLQFIRDLDLSARILIGFLLSEAASSAIKTSREWTKLAEEAGADSGVAEVLIHFVSSSVVGDSGAASNEREREILHKRLQDRIDRLETFFARSDSCSRQTQSAIREPIADLKSNGPILGDFTLQLRTRDSRGECGPCVAVVLLAVGAGEGGDVLDPSVGTGRRAGCCP